MAAFQTRILGISQWKTALGIGSKRNIVSAYSSLSYSLMLNVNSTGTVSIFPRAIVLLELCLLLVKNGSENRRNGKRVSNQKN